MGDRSPESDLAREVVVCNSTPLINLAAIDRLDLLGPLFGGVLVPDEVWQELRSGQAAPPTFAAVERSGLVRTATIIDRALHTSLSEKRDRRAAAPGRSR